MKLNMGLIDRIIRAVIVAVIAVLYFTKTISGTVAIVLEVVAVLFLLTSIIGWCPTYHVLGLSSMTKKEKEAMEARKAKKQQ